MSTFSPNTTIKYSAPISNNLIAGTVIQTIYTCPANSYAEVMLSIDANAITVGTALTVSIGGRNIGSFWRTATNSIGFAGVATFNMDPGAIGQVFMNTGLLKVAAGQLVQVRTTAFNVAVTIVGVQFINTP